MELLLGDPTLVLGSSCVNDYRILNIIGSGTFGTVYKAENKSGPKIEEINRNHGGYYALKLIYSTSKPSRILNELKVMEKLSGQKNVVTMLDCFEYNFSSIVIMPYFEHDDFKTYYTTLSMDKILGYMKGLLTALAATEKNGVIHRDVKPRNVLFRVKDSALLLVDFGLAEEELKWKARMKRPLKSQRQRPAEKSSYATATTRNDSPLISDAKRPCSDNRTTSRRTAREILEGSNSKASGGPVGAAAAGAAPAAAAPPPLPPPRGGGAWAAAARRRRRRQARPAAAGAGTAGVVGGGRPAERAGTPGFRAPEVLLGSSEQTPALDVWSAGVCFLGLLLGRHPVFPPVTVGPADPLLATPAAAAGGRCSGLHPQGGGGGGGGGRGGPGRGSGRRPGPPREDAAALVQLASLLGRDRLARAAAALGKEIMCIPRACVGNLPLKMDVNTDCFLTERISKLSARHDLRTTAQKRFEAAIELALMCLELDPTKRVKAEDALCHFVFAANQQVAPPSPLC